MMVGIELGCPLAAMPEPAADDMEIDPRLGEPRSGSVTKRVGYHVRGESSARAGHSEGPADAFKFPALVGQDIGRCSPCVRPQEEPAQPTGDGDDRATLRGLLSSWRIEVDAVAVEIDLRPAEIEQRARPGACGDGQQNE